MYSLRSILYAGVLALSGTWLLAQMDPKLQVCKTDVLDVYGGTKASAKPEIITLIDNSGSMEALAWDSRYYASVRANFHAWGDGENDTAYGYLKKLNNVYLGQVTTEVFLTIDVGTTTIYGRLVKPDGDMVTSADVGGSTALNDWLQRASHVRFSFSSNTTSDTAVYTYKGVTYQAANRNYKAQDFIESSLSYSATTSDLQGANKARVVDIPLPWAVFDRVFDYEKRTLSPDPAYMATARAKKHPQHMYLYDNLAGSTAQWYEVDTNWWESSGSGGQGGTMVDNNGFIRPTIRFHKDYLWWCFFGKDVRNAAETGDVVSKYTGSNVGGYVVSDIRDNTDQGFTFKNELPAMTRLQAIKYALIKTWITEQDKVWWAIRFLNGCASGGGFKENGRSSAAKCFNSANLKGNPGDRMLLRLAKPSSAQNPDVNMRYIQVMNAPNWTPLTFGLLNSYAQMASTDNGANGSVFGEQKTERPVHACRESFVVVLSDGAPNDDASDCSQGRGTALGTGDPFSGGTFPTIQMRTIAPRNTTVANQGINFNIWTLAGVAAHVDPADDDKNYWPTDDDNAGVKPPFKITTRPNGTTRRISTMTIGVSMTGRRTDAGSAKAAMYKAALYGWRHRGKIEADALGNYPPFPYDPNNPQLQDKNRNPFFFDAQSPEAIADALALVFDLARNVTNTMSAPVAPLVGLGVGNQMYLGTFTSSPDPIWDGDLLTVGMKVSGSKVTLLHKSGGALTGPVNVDSAVWSAANAIKARGWKNRVLYFLKPNGSGGFTTELKLWNENTSETDLPNGALNVSSTAERLKVLRFVMGASKEAQEETTNPATKTTNRHNIMGSIVNSTPAVLELPYDTAPAALKSGLAALLSDPTNLLSDKRYRLIIVGTNQGVLHGFGEVSGTETLTVVENVLDENGNPTGETTTSTTYVLRAVVDELWGIIPPDVMGGLSGWMASASPGKPRYLVDGSPVLYHNEGSTPNGYVDGNDFVRVLFGLRKGGRSYYALSFTGNDPTKPVVSWMVRPDDVTGTEPKDLAIKSMGFSTSTPVAARIHDGSVLKDVFLLGGGLSTQEVDTAFGRQLGRSVLAFEVDKGLPVKVWDFVNDTSLKTTFNADNSFGCVPSGVIPVEVLMGSYKTQRVYFSENSGAIYALGARASSGLRLDTSDVTKWGVRAVFKTKHKGTVISTTPAVFPLANGYPVIRSSAPAGIVPSLGLAFGLGDRNDPMDIDSVDPMAAGATRPPYQNRFVVMLDRQDSADITVSGGSADNKGLSEDQLYDLTTVSDPNANVINPNHADYYLKSTFGYRLEFAQGVLQPGETSKWFFEKVVTSPIVLSGSLFFTKFFPNSSNSQDPCVGAGGSSKTFRLSKILSPVYDSGNRKIDDTHEDGWYYSFNDIPSELASVGMGAVLQVGEVDLTDPDAGVSGGVGDVKPISIPAPNITTLPRPRAWRIVR